jgi:8-oxo-dGTP diphosphatase
MLKLATLCYVRRPGQTLMIHRIKRAGDMHAGKWNGLGGKLEPGETPEACARREIYEESGLQVTDLQMRGFLTFPAFRLDEDWYAFVFTAQAQAGELIDPPEGVLAWIDDGRLVELPLWEGDRIFLPWLEGERFFSARFVYVEGRLVAHDVVFYPPEAETSALREPAEHVPAGAARNTQHAYTAADDTYCWVCNGPVIKRHCKIVCQACGFTRDCSDP